MADTSGKRPILIVEDVKEISAQMAAMLQRKGQRVTYASDAVEAINMAESERPTMILTDLDLPTFDELIRLVRAHTDLKNLLVAIIDINAPKVQASDGLRVLQNFAQLDELISSAI